MTQTECLRISDSLDETRFEQVDRAASMDVQTQEEEWCPDTLSMEGKK